MKDFLIRLLKAFWNVFRYILSYCIVVVLFAGAMLCAIYLSADYIGSEIIAYQKKVLADFDIANFTYAPSLTTQIYSKDGTLISEIYDENRKYITYSQMPENLVNAFIATEDKRFYSHHGVDPKGAVRVLALAARDGEASQGASTITMQLTRGLFLSNERSVERKLKEMIISLELEKTFDKHKLLEMYLNEIYLGNRSYGVEAASQGYFGKTVKDLDLNEITLLAGLPQAPSRYDLYKNLDLAKERRLAVLDSMLGEGLLTESKVKALKDAEVTLKSNKDTKLTVESTVHPYFTNWVIEQLEKTFGKQIYTSGWKIYTTIDDTAQSIAEQVALEQSSKYAKNFNANDIAIVSINPQNGELIAMVGGADFSKNQINMAVKPRQTGSTMKPIVYSAAIENGVITDSSIVLDEDFSVGNYNPNNYDNKHRGYLTVREALTISNNIVALKVAQKVGVDSIIDYAEKMGVTTLDKKNDAGLGMAIGGLYEGISPYEMATVYGVFANDGVYVAPNYISKIVDSRGQNLYVNKLTEKNVLSVQTTDQITSMLRNVVKSGTGTAARIDGVEVAGKTGTTNDSKDVWFVGYTPNVSTAVWVGNSNSTNTVQKSGIGSASTIAWQMYMSEYLKNVEKKAFKPDYEFVDVELYVNKDGDIKLPGEYCTPSIDGELGKDYAVKTFRIRANQVPTEKADCEYQSPTEFFSRYIGQTSVTSERIAKVKELVNKGYLQSMADSGFIDDLAVAGYIEELIQLGYRSVLERYGYVEPLVDNTQIPEDNFTNSTSQPINPPDVLSPEESYEGNLNIPKVEEENSQQNHEEEIPTVVIPEETHNKPNENQSIQETEEIDLSILDIDN